MTTNTDHPGAAEQALYKQSRGAVGMLAAEFLLGMGVNLIGPVSEAKGATKVVVSILLGLHVLVAVGLAVTAGRAVPAARGTANSNLAIAGAVAIGVTIIAGFGTMSTDSPWLSYLMAVGFLASVLIYGRLLVATTDRSTTARA